jgi:hypothetical protein
VYLDALGIDRELELEALGLFEAGWLDSKEDDEDLRSEARLGDIDWLVHNILDRTQRIHSNTRVRQHKLADRWFHAFRG